MTTDLKLSSFSAFLTVWGVIGLGIMLLMYLVASVALSSLPEVNCQIIEYLSIVESLEEQSSLLFSCSISNCFLILPIVDFPRSVFDLIWCKK